MGLYMNEDKELKVYRNDEELIAPNQNMYRQDDVADMMEAQRKEQRTAHDQLYKSLQEIEKSYEKQSTIQTKRIADIRFQIEELHNSQKKRREENKQAVQSMTQLHEENEVLSKKIEQQIELQKEMSETLSKQDAFQNEVIERLENQEALTEKVLRKVDQFRSILYERTHYISEKVGKGYEATSAYITKLIRANASSNTMDDTKEREKSIK